MLKYTYQQTALGRPLAEMPVEIRAEHRAVFDGISRAYHPSMTHTCKNGDEQSNQDIQEKLKSIFDLGAGSEDALAQWRRAIALFRGGGYGMTTSEYVNIQRRLLQAELSRQGLTQNMKNVILQNFDCYKSRSTDAKDVMEALRARKECLQFPVIGVDRLFQGWRAHVSSARTTDDRAKRTTTLQSRQARSVDIAAMYSHIIPLMSAEEDLNTNTLESLIELHIDLQATNEMIEKRIPKMQNNCMK